jgi:hypothetical protein
MAKPHRDRRAARISIPNREQATITSFNKTVNGTLCKLSVSGGSISLTEFFDRGSFAEIRLNTTSGIITCPIQFLRTRVDGVSSAQAFRFIQMDPKDRARLDLVLQHLRAQGFGEQAGGVLQPLVQAFRALRTMI